MKELLLIGPVVLLFLAGGLIAVHSGGSTGRGWARARVLGGNFLALAIRVVAYAGGLVVVQRAIGSPSILPW